MDQDRMDEFRKISQHMRETLEEVDAMLQKPPSPVSGVYALTLCAHCLEVKFCSLNRPLVLCVGCGLNSDDGWLVVVG